MATQTLGSVGNIFDIMQLKAPNGGVIDVTNTLVETNDLMKDLPALPSNGGLFHQGSRITSLPNGSLVNVGGYWASTKAAREPFVEALATIRDSWECPLDVLQTEGPDVSQALVRSEKDLHIEGNGQAWCNLVVTGSTTPAQNDIDGLMKRAPWMTIDSEYCWDVGGTTNLRSAWLIKPDPALVHLIYNPHHPTLGVEQQDMGKSRQVDQSDATGGTHRWIVTIEFLLQMGICIRDQRAVKRIANVPCAASDNPTSTLVNTVIKAALKHNVMTRRMWFLYCDADLYSQLVIGANDVLKVHISDKNIYSTALSMIGTDIIIRRLDALNYATGSGETEVV